MGNQDRYFILGGIISFTLFSLFVSLFFFMMFKKSHIETFAMNKKNFISVSLDIAPKVVKKIKQQPKPTPTVQKVAEAAPEVSEDVDVNDLFSDVWTKKIPKPKAKHKRRVDSLTKKIQKTKQNNVMPITEKISQVNNEKQATEKQSQSAGSEVNKYLAKIQAIIYKYFQVPPNAEGESVKIVIELDALGKMLDFRILRYSANDALNQEADHIKDRLRGVIFPVNPKHKTSRTVVILEPKE